MDVRGIRRLASKLPDWLIPDPKKQGELVLKTIHGVALHINPAIDNGVELSLFRTGTYEKGILDYIQKHFKGEGTFIDVGANIGLISLFTADQFPKAMVHAFEAHPETSQILDENCLLNKVTNIEIHEFALGNEEKQVELYDNWDVNRGGASIVVKSDSSNAYSVQMKRLDGLNVGKPEMIKIDVEGFELEVLKGAQELIKQNLPVLILEISDWRKNAHDSSSEIVEYVKKLGPYKVFKLSGGKERRSKLQEVKSNTDLPEHDNIICIAQ